MWIPDTALEIIGTHLDIKGLIRLYASSKECKQLLKKKLCNKIREHTPSHMARLIIQARRNLPSGYFSMQIKDELQLKFTDHSQSEEARGTVILFTAEVKQGKLEIMASYAETEDGWHQCVGHIKAEITPSDETPMLTGNVKLETDINQSSTRHIEYTNGLDPMRVVEWFPLDIWL